MLEKITSGLEWRGEFQNKKKNDELFWVSASVTPVRDEHDTITHFLVIEEDISERVRSEELIGESESKYKLVSSCESGP